MVKIILAIIIYVLATLSPVSNTSFAEEDTTPKVIEHKVEEGDNLYLLAAYYLNNPRLWKEIYLSNKDSIVNPNQLTVGSTLKITIKDKDWQPKFPIELWRAKKPAKQVK